MRCARGTGLSRFRPRSRWLRYFGVRGGMYFVEVEVFRDAPIAVVGFLLWGIVRVKR